MHSSTFGMAKLLLELNINNFHYTIFLIQVFNLFSVPVVVCWEIFSFFHVGNKNKQIAYYDSVFLRLLREP